jgi:hypothetical protein
MKPRLSLLIACVLTLAATAVSVAPEDAAALSAVAAASTPATPAFGSPQPKVMTDPWTCYDMCTASCDSEWASCVQGCSNVPSCERGCEQQAYGCYEFCWFACWG